METLKDLTKKAMNYTEERKVCEHCKYKTERSDIKGSEWDECSYSDLANFRIKTHGSCDKWVKKIKEKDLKG